MVFSWSPCCVVKGDWDSQADDRGFSLIEVVVEGFLGEVVALGERGRRGPVAVDILRGWEEGEVFWKVEERGE